MNLEVISFKTLDRLQRSVTLSDEKEHVTLHVCRNPANFNVCTLNLGKPKYEGLRVTAECQADYALTCFIHEKLYFPKQIFHKGGIDELLKKRPWAKLINANLKQEQ